MIFLLKHNILQFVISRKFHVYSINGLERLFWKFMITSISIRIQTKHCYKSGKNSIILNHVLNRIPKFCIPGMGIPLPLLHSMNQMRP